MTCYPCPKPSCVLSLGRSFWSIVCQSTLEQLVNRYWLINYEDDCHCQLHWIFSYVNIFYVNLKGNQSWILIGKTDAKAEVPVFWSSDVKSQLIGKVSDAGKIEGRRRRGCQRMRWLDDINEAMDTTLVRDREAWHATAHGIAKSQTWLGDWTTTMTLYWKAAEGVSHWLEGGTQWRCEPLLVTVTQEYGLMVKQEGKGIHSQSQRLRWTQQETRRDPDKGEKWEWCTLTEVFPWPTNVKGEKLSQVEVSQVKVVEGLLLGILKK